MSRKSKIDPVEKVKVIERYLCGELNIIQAGSILGVVHSSVQSWVRLYKSEVPDDSDNLLLNY